MAEVGSPDEIEQWPNHRGYRITVTPTIQDGTVIRWFTSDYSMERCEPIVSASRNAVIVRDLHLRSSADRTELDHLLDWAMAWQGRILNGERMTHLATHERQGLTGPLVERVLSGSLSKETNLG